MTPELQPVPPWVSPFAGQATLRVDGPLNHHLCNFIRSRPVLTAHLDSTQNDTRQVDDISSDPKIHSEFAIPKSGYTPTNETVRYPRHMILPGTDDASSANQLSPTVSLVLPCFNEVNNLEVVFSRIPDYVTEVVFVDGGSTDGSIDKALSLRPDLVLLGQHAPGKGLALIIGLLAASSDIVVMADTDCSTDLGEMDAFMAALIGGADLAKGTRHLPPGGSDDFTHVRRVGNWVLSKLVNILYGTKWTDLAYGYAAFWTDAINRIGLQEIYELEVSEEAASSRRPQHYGHGFEIETLLFCRTAASGFRVVEVTSFEHVRVLGSSNLSAIRDGFRVLRGISEERWGRHRQRLAVATTIDERMAARRRQIADRAGQAADGQNADEL